MREFYAGAHVDQKGIAQNEMLEELGIATFRPILVQEDNQACIWYSEHTSSCERTERIRRMVHLVHQHASERAVK